jgi:PAS domain S-box-containing protein
MLTALSQVVLVVDEKGRVVYRNASAEAEGVDPTVSPRTMHAAREVIAKRSPSDSVEEVREGRRFRVEVRPCPVGDALGAILEYRDVTTLHDVEEGFRTLVDGSPDIVFITDASSRMLYANAALEEQTGYNVDDFQMAQADNRLIHPDDQERVAAFLGEFVASGRKYSGPVKNRFIARDGKILWYSSVVSRSQFEGQPVLQFVVHNITQQEEAREELARVQNQLFERERLAALGELAAIVAHEIRNPLSIIYNALTTLRKAPPTDDTNVLLGIVEDEAARLQRTVRDLLDFTRPMTPSFETCDLAAIAQEALAEVASRDGRGINVSFDAATRPYLADVDRHLMHRVAVNLIANAYQAMPSGGEVSIDLARVEGKDAAARVELRVTDSGPGIASDAAARIFEPFFTTRATGTGLGLALAKRIVDLHHGTISATTASSGGACFTVSLPVSQSTR